MKQRYNLRLVQLVRSTVEQAGRLLIPAPHVRRVYNYREVGHVQHTQFRAVGDAEELELFCGRARSPPLLLFHLHCEYLIVEEEHLLVGSLVQFINVLVQLEVHGEELV